MITPGIQRVRRRRRPRVAEYPAGLLDHRDLGQPGRALIRAAAPAPPTPTTRSATSAAQVTVSQAGTTLAYTGPQSASSGARLRPGRGAGQPGLHAPGAGERLSFTLNVNPATGAAGPYSLGSATTNGSRRRNWGIGSPPQAGWRVPTPSPPATPGPPTAAPPTATAPLAVTTPGLAAACAGRYTVTGVGPVKLRLRRRPDPAHHQSIWAASAWSRTAPGG